MVPDVVRVSLSVNLLIFWWTGQLSPNLGAMVAFILPYISLHLHKSSGKAWTQLLMGCLSSPLVCFHSKSSWVLVRGSQDSWKEVGTSGPKCAGVSVCICDRDVVGGGGEREIFLWCPPFFLALGEVISLFHHPLLSHANWKSWAGGGLAGSSLQFFPPLTCETGVSTVQTLCWQNLMKLVLRAALFQNTRDFPWDGTDLDHASQWLSHAKMAGDF